MSQPYTSGPDVATSWCIAEVKDRRKLAGWIKGALAKVRARAKSSRLGIVVLHEQGSRNDLVVMAMSDFTDWFRGKYDKTDNSI